MNGNRFLIDTNVLIDAQMKKLPENGLTLLAEAINQEFNVSFITYIEFLGYKEATTATEQFISLANVIEINKEIINSCIFLRKTQNIKLPDAIIASTAIIFDLTLLSHNFSDFKKIPKLRITDLYNF